MLCQKCQKNLATVRYAEVVDGKVRDLRLCPECMAVQQGESNAGFGLSGSAPAPKRAAQSRKRPGRDETEVVCPSCGQGSFEVARTRRMSCPVCYDSFKSILEPLLRELHSSVIHRGRTPHMDDERERFRIELQTKRALLRTALKSENYEEAAVLRDDIQRLEESVGLVVTGRR